MSPVSVLAPPPYVSLSLSLSGTRTCMCLYLIHVHTPMLKRGFMAVPIPRSLDRAKTAAKRGAPTCYNTSFHKNCSLKQGSALNRPMLMLAIVVIVLIVSVAVAATMVEYRGHQHRQTTSQTTAAAQVNAVRIISKNVTTPQISPTPRIATLALQTRFHQHHC